MTPEDHVVAPPGFGSCGLRWAAPSWLPPSAYEDHAEARLLLLLREPLRRFARSCSAPSSSSILQKWFGLTRAKRANDGRLNSPTDLSWHFPSKHWNEIFPVHLN